MAIKMSLIGAKGKLRVRAGREYGPGTFSSLGEAYSQYTRDRLSDIKNPTLAPKKKFATIWGWGKKKK